MSREGVMGFPSLGRTSRFMPQAAQRSQRNEPKQARFSTDWPQPRRRVAAKPTSQFGDLVNGQVTVVRMSTSEGLLVGSGIADGC
jgi:hypothetical protein